ncbi:MAG: phenylalanine--tRNA ligase subunit beta [Anaerolineae bacterium]|jgi:phenylalanyl-tRNA synthetase beta chain
MRVPLSWLKEYVDIPVSVSELARRLTVAGLEVETIEFIGLPGAELPWDPEKIVVGEVVAVHPHPNADRLVLAEVDYGGSETEVVVSGPPSLREMEGQSGLQLKVAFATEGADLYDGYAETPQIKTLKRSKIRGVVSRGMVCSEKELGLSEVHEDILYLPDDAPVGTPLADYLGDAVLTFDIKGPFNHLQSVYGIARETAALLDVPLRKDVLRVQSQHGMKLTSGSDFVDLEIPDPDLCLRYSAAIIRGVQIGPSPFWMQTRLRRAGMRPINNIVDVTNYVMLELGQPLHAFDYHVLRPRPGEKKPAIIIRRAEAVETMHTLDGVLRTFDEEVLLITDGQGPVAVAGVMGGLESEVDEETSDVLLESANFDFLNVRRTSRLLGLNTEASQRFGRRVDPEMTTKAAARAARLMAQLAGGTVEPTIADLYPGQRPPTEIAFDPEEAHRILGLELSADEIVRILSSLEFDVTETAPGTRQVTVPTHRQDVTQTIDLIEEVGRIWGYDRFPRTLMRDELPPQRANPRLEGAERVRDLLVGCGLDEVITYSLVDLQDEAALWPPEEEPDLGQHLKVLNPLSSERAHLRRTLLPSLLHTTRDNLRFTERVQIFEVGAIYVPLEGQTLPDEPLWLCVVMTGPREDRSWMAGQDRTLVDFFDLKGVVEALLDGLDLEVAFAAGEHPAFHPGRCATVRVGDAVVGTMGELHPLVREAFELPEQPVCALELDLEQLLGLRGGPQWMTPISAHPPVYEDLAVVVDEQVPAVEVRDLIAQTGSPLVRSVVLFDVYRGEQVGPGRKSLAYCLTYQAEDRTLTDREVAKLRDKIVHRLGQEVGAVLRG